MFDLVFFVNRPECGSGPEIFVFNYKGKVRRIEVLEETQDEIKGRDLDDSGKYKTFKREFVV